MALTIPNRFTNGQTIDASKFNSNFDSISSWASGIDTDLDAAEAAIDVIEAGYGSCAFFAYASTDQAITASTYTTVVFSDTGTDAFDTNSCFASNVYTPSVAGAYQLNVLVAADVGELTSSETLTVYITKNTSSRYGVLSLAAGTATSGGASIILKANGTTDTFKVEVYGSACEIDYAKFSGFCIKPD